MLTYADVCVAVCSGMSDFAAERDVCAKWLLPALQALVRESDSSSRDLSAIDLRHGGAEQCSSASAVGIRASLQARMRTYADVC